MPQDEKRERESKLAPGIAPGVEGLEQKASPKDIAENNATRVTKLIYDELEPSED